MYAFFLNTRFIGLFFCTIFLFSACSKDTGETVEVLQLELQASASEVHEGGEVFFTVTANGEPISADIYIDKQKVDGDSYIFSNVGSYEVVAKKENYKDSEQVVVQVIAQVHDIDIYVVGTQNTTASDVSTPQAFVWKNGEILYEIKDDVATVGPSGIALYGDDVYVAGTISGFNRVAKYWKNTTAYSLTDGTKNASVSDIAIDKIGNIYVIGTDDNVHRPVLWKNSAVQSLSTSNENRYVREIAVSDAGNFYIAGNSSSYANTPSVAILWKNAQEVHLTSGATSGRGMHVALDNNDVYVLGDENTKGIYESGGKLIAKYWKNGFPILIDEDQEEVLVSVVSGGISVDKGDVYVCGMLADGKSAHGRAVVWKNGKRLYELTDGETNNNVVDIVVVDNQVYTLGVEKNIGNTGKHVIKVWKNDKVLYELTDGTRRGTATAFAIKVAQ